MSKYVPMQNQGMIKIFTELIELKEQKNVLEKKIKALEAQYKPMVELSNQDALYFELPNHKRFSIVKSERKGNINTKKLEEKLGINVDEFRNKPSTVFTMRIAKGDE